MAETNGEVRMSNYIGAYLLAAALLALVLLPHDHAWQKCLLGLLAIIQVFVLGRLLL